MTDETNTMDAVLDPATPPRRGRPPKAENILTATPAPAPVNELELKAAQPRAVPSTVRLQQPEGPKVRMRVTAKGDMQISTGDHYGFERYGMFAEFFAEDQNARSLYNKGWAEPVDDARATVQRWERENGQDRARDAKALAARDHLLEHGAAVGTTGGWNG